MAFFSAHNWFLKTTEFCVKKSTSIQGYSICFGWNFLFMGWDWKLQPSKLDEKLNALPVWKVWLGNNDVDRLIALCSSLDCYSHSTF